MSTWYEADPENIDIDWDRKELDIFVKQDDFGSVYVTLKISDFEDIFTKIYPYWKGKLNLDNPK